MPKKQYEGSFDADGFFKSQGMIFDSIAPSGNPVVVDKQGNKQEFHVDDFAKSQLGLPAEKVDFTFNNMGTALPVSPLSAEDRAKWATGDVNTYKEAMSKRFDDTAYDPEDGIIVKDKGVWKKLDPGFFEGGDPWKIAESLLKAGNAVQKLITPADYLDKGNLESGVKDATSGYKDALKAGYNFLTKGLPSGAKNAAIVNGIMMGMDPNSPEAQQALGTFASTGIKAVPAALEMAGQVAGQEYGGKPASALGAGAGRVGGNYIVHSLGRLMGTYNVDPGEEATQNLMEGIMSALGTSMAPGQKPTAEAIDNTFLRANKELAPQVKGTLEKGMVASGMRPKAANYVANETEDFIAKRKELWGAVGKGKKDVQALANDRASQAAEQILKEARPALSAVQGQQYEALYEAAAKNGASLDKAQVAKQMAQVLEDQGFGKVAFDEEKNRWAFREFNDLERTARQQNMLPATSLQPDEMQAIRRYMKQINDNATGTLDGRAAGKYMADLNKEINKIHSSVVGRTGPSENVDRIMAQLSGNMRNIVGEHMNQAGLSNEWKAISSVQDHYIDAVRWAEGAADKNAGPMGLVKAIMDPAGSQPTITGERGYLPRLQELLGDKGSKSVKDVIGYQSVADATPLWKSSIGAALGATGAATSFAAFHNPVVAGAIAVPMLATSSPRTMVATQLASRKWLSLVKSIPQKDLYKALTDSALAPALMRPLVTAEMEQFIADRHVKQSLNLPVHDYE